MTYKENEPTIYQGVTWLFDRWKEKHIVIPVSQRRIYETLGRIYQGKTIVDCGSGTGIGANILSHTALSVWAIDLEPELVDFGSQLFSSPKLKFDQYDLLNPPSRPHAAFDVVICSEVIEHIPSEKWDTALNNLKRFFKEGTVGFISTPNRNAPEINDEYPNNPAHTKELSAGELYELLTKHFQSVVLFDANRLQELSLEETVDGSSGVTPIVAKLEGIINE